MSVSRAARSFPCFTFASRVAAFENTAIGSCCAGLSGVSFSATALFW